MSFIDKYIDELRRSGETSLILLSESEPRLRGKAGERSLEGKVSHKEVTALVEEIIPPECFADLVMMEPVEFPFSHEAGELSIRVVPGPSIWRVVAEVRGDGLAPMRAGTSNAEESSSRTLSGLGTEKRDGPAPARAEPVKEPVAESVGVAPSPGSTNPLDEAMSEAVGSLARVDDNVSLSELLLAEQGGLLDEDDGDIDLASILPDAGAFSVEAGGAGDAPAIALDRHNEPVSGSPYEQEQRSTKHLDQFIPGVELGVHTAAVGAPESEGPSGSGAFELEDPRDALADDDAVPARPPLGSPPPAPTTARAVEPLEIDFGVGDVPLLAIEALDALMDAAWSQGATGLLLRDRRVPLMVRGGEVSELAFGTRDQGRLVNDILDSVVSPSQAEQLEIMGQCRFVYLNGSATRVRCTLVQDGGALAVSLRRIGDEHLPESSEQWMPDAVRKVLPSHGLVLVCGTPGQGKTTTATALIVNSHRQQTVVVAEPLERRLKGESAGLLQRSVPDDVPNCAQALGDTHLLEAPLVLVDVPRPAQEALALLSLVAQGRLLIVTWTAPDCVEAIQGFMDALPPELAPAERARRVRSLTAVIAVRLVPVASGGVLPIFEVLRTNPALLGAVAESRLDALRGTEIRQLTFESSRTLLVDRGLL